MNDPYNTPPHKPFDVVDFTAAPRRGTPAIVNDDVQIGRLVRALNSEGLCFTCVDGRIVIHPRRV